MKISRSNLFSNVLILLVASLVSILLIEIYLIINNYPHQNCEVVHESAELSLGEFNNQTGWSYKKSTSYGKEYSEYQYHFNEDGIRVISPNYTADQIKPKIVFIGGSVTFGEQLNYEDTFPYKIGELLENKFEIINLGVQGFGSAQSMLHLKSLITKIKPQYIIYTFIPDHINRDMNYDRRLQTKCLDFIGTKPVFTLKNNELKQIKKPRQYAFTDKFKFRLFLNMNLQNFIEKRMIKNGEGKAITKKIINEISNIASKNNADDFYIFYDTHYNPLKNSWNKKLLNYMFDDVSQYKHLDFTNWAEDSQTNIGKYYVGKEDFYHPNESLSTEIANRFVIKFKKNLTTK